MPGAQPTTSPSRLRRLRGHQGLGVAGMADRARVIVRKAVRTRSGLGAEPQPGRTVGFPEDSIFRIDHFLAKEAIMNILYFRFANFVPGAIWNATTWQRQITLSEDFGVRAGARSTKPPAVCAT